MRRVGMLLAAGLLVAGCSGSGGGSGAPFGIGSGGGGGTGDGGTTGTAAQNAYGYGAKMSGVDYQPGVVVVGGGPGGIVSASADGLTWTIRRDAPGADRLQVGRVMLMTSVVAGRVAAIRDEGADRVVTIAPVQLTDILRNGAIDVHQPIDPGTVRFRPVPGLAAAPMTPAPSDLPSATHSLRGTGAAAAAGVAVEPTLPPPVKFEGTIPIGPFEVKPSYSSNGELGASVEYTGPGGLKLTFGLMFTTQDLAVTGSLHVENGAARRPTLRITGITGMQVSIGAGAAHGSADNGKFTLELPGEVEVPIPPSPATAGLPLTLTLKYKLSVETALTGNNATLLATGEYKLDGPIGVDAGYLLTPKFSVEKSLIDSISGITLGPSGVVVAMNITTQLGVGPPLVNGGPSTGITIAVGVTNGSSLGAPLARCHGASLDLDGSFGVSLNIAPGVAAVLKHVLPKDTKIEIGTEVKTSLLHRSQVVPDVPLCRG